MHSVQDIVQKLAEGDFRALARAISLVENESAGYEEILRSATGQHHCPIVGITGPPGAGKSTLVNALAVGLADQGKKVAIIAVDPTSPFNKGSLLGDRIRMSGLFTHPNVFIRSLATRGSLGGLSAKAIEVTEVTKAAGFDYILVETVGVGQSEVEICGLADTTIVVLVPEAGDEIQSIKSGLMEIADIFVVNKADRDGAATFANNLRKLLHDRPAKTWNVPVLKTVSSRNEGIPELQKSIEEHAGHYANEHRSWLMVEKAWQLIERKRMKDLDKTQIEQLITQALTDKNFNLYRFIERF